MKYKHTRWVYRCCLITQQLALSIPIRFNNEENSCWVYWHGSVIKRCIYLFTYSYIYVYIYLYIHMPLSLSLSSYIYMYAWRGRETFSNDSVVSICLPDRTHRYHASGKFQQDRTIRERGHSQGASVSRRENTGYPCRCGGECRGCGNKTCSVSCTYPAARSDHQGIWHHRALRDAGDRRLQRCPSLPCRKSSRALARRWSARGDRQTEVLPLT